MCDQQSLRSACAYAQTDQSLCQPLEYSMSVKLLAEHHLEFLSFEGGCTSSSESTLVKMSHCWKSHVAARMCFSPYANQCITCITHYADRLSILQLANCTQVNRMSRSRRVLAIGGKQRIFGLDMVCIETILFHLDSL